MNNTKKHAKRHFEIDNTLHTKHLSIFRRVPVASQRVLVSRLPVLMSRLPVPVASQQVLMGSKFAINPGPGGQIHANVILWTSFRGDVPMTQASPFNK